MDGEGFWYLKFFYLRKKKNFAVNNGLTSAKHVAGSPGKRKERAVSGIIGRKGVGDGLYEFFVKILGPTELGKKY